MLRLLTQKLRTQSLDEVDRPSHHRRPQNQKQNPKQNIFQNNAKSDKVDDEKDSGTESDDENIEFDDENAGFEHDKTDPEDCHLGMDTESSELRRSARLCANTSSSVKRTYFTNKHVAPKLTASYEVRFNRDGNESGNDIKDESDDEDDCHSLLNQTGGLLLLRKKLAPSPVLAQLLDPDSALPSDSDHFENYISKEDAHMNPSMSTKSSSTESLPNVPTHKNVSSASRRQGTVSPTPNSSGLFRRQLRTRSKSTSNRLQLCNNANDNKITKQEQVGNCLSNQREKRKWFQVNVRSKPNDSSTGSSSDDEVRNLMRDPATPVEFHTSPPTKLLTPLTKSACTKSLSCDLEKNLTDTYSHPTKLFHFSSSNFSPFEVCSVSPRKRYRGLNTSITNQPLSSGLLSTGTCKNTKTKITRPCLDFEKMQQVGHYN